MELLKQRKEAEQKVHESLHNNLTLLSHFYPTSKEFNAVFRREMFAKNNKAAFFEVIHYLLNIINPELTKQKLTTWPLHDVKLESKFRSEVIQYINSLNQIYPYANIPMCQASSLISPGGHKFAKFMLKVSQFVLFKHLERSEEPGLLYPTKPHKHLGINGAQNKHIMKTSASIDEDSQKLLKSFEEFYVKKLNEAEEIDNSLNQLNKDIQSVQKQFDEVQGDFDKKYPLYPAEENIQEKLVIIKTQVENISKTRQLFNTCEELLKCISGTDLLLEHNEDNLIVPEEVQHIIRNRHELDLVQFFDGLGVLLQKKSLELCDPTPECIQLSLEMFGKLSVRYKDILEQLQAEEEHLTNLFHALKDFVDDTTSESDNLALPLPSTSL